MPTVKLAVVRSQMGRIRTLARQHGLMAETTAHRSFALSIWSPFHRMGSWDSHTSFDMEVPFNGDGEKLLLEYRGNPDLFPELRAFVDKYCPTPATV